MAHPIDKWISDHPSFAKLIRTNSTVYHALKSMFAMENLSDSQIVGLAYATSAWKLLSYREKMVLYQRFPGETGMKTEACSISQAARISGCTPGRVRYIQKKATDKLRLMLYGINKEASELIASQDSPAGKQTIDIPPKTRLS